MPSSSPRLAESYIRTNGGNMLNLIAMVSILLFGVMLGASSYRRRLMHAEYALIKFRFERDLLLKLWPEQAYRPEASTSMPELYLAQVSDERSQGWTPRLHDGGHSFIGGTIPVGTDHPLPK